MRHQLQTKSGKKVVLQAIVDPDTVSDIIQQVDLEVFAKFLLSFRGSKMRLAADLEGLTRLIASFNLDGSVKGYPQEPDEFVKRLMRLVAKRYALRYTATTID